MTKHEAANLLQALVNSGAAYIRPNKRIINALRLAIDALEKCDRWEEWCADCRKTIDETLEDLRKTSHAGCTSDACPIEGVKQDER